MRLRHAIQLLEVAEGCVCQKQCDIILYVVAFFANYKLRNALAESCVVVVATAICEMGYMLICRCAVAAAVLGVVAAVVVVMLMVAEQN